MQCKLTKGVLHKIMFARGCSDGDLARSDLLEQILSSPLMVAALIHSSLHNRHCMKNEKRKVERDTVTVTWIEVILSMSNAPQLQSTRM